LGQDATPGALAPAGQFRTKGGPLPSTAAWERYVLLLRRRRRSQETIDLYRVVLRELWAFLADQHHDWRQVTPELVDAWLDSQVRAAWTRNTYGRVVRRFYACAVSRGWLDGPNPLEDWTPPPAPPPRPRALPLDAIGELLAVVDPRIRMMVLLGYFQALRVGEIVRLSVEDLALGADPPMIRIDGKGGKQVWMPLSPALVGPLRTFLLLRPARGPLIPNHRDPDRHLHPKYAAHLLASVMRPVVGDSGHALRHTAARQLRRQTHDPFLVRDALRHAGLGSLEFYTQDPETLAAALGLLPDPLGDGASR
jgi:integrase